MFGQELCCTFSDKADAQAIYDSLQRQLLGIFNFSQNILCRLGAHAIETQQLILCHLVNISNVFHHAFLGELRNQRVAHAINVHHSA